LKRRGRHARRRPARVRRSRDARRRDARRPARRPPRSICSPSSCGCAFEVWRCRSRRWPSCFRVKDGRSCRVDRCV